MIANDLITNDNDGSVIDIGRHKGLHGITPTIGEADDSGKLLAAWIGSEQYVRQDLIAIPLKAPGALSFLPNSERWVRAWKRLWTDHVKKITGLNSGISIQTGEQEIGRTGQFQEVTTGVKYIRSTLSTEFQEVTLKSMSKFIINLVKYCDEEPITGKPLAADLVSIDEIAGGWTAELSTGTLLLVEPDISRKLVVEAFYCCNVGPKGDINSESSRDPASGGEIISLPVEWKVIALATPKARELAEKLLPVYLAGTKTLPGDIELADDGISPDLEEDE